MGRRRRGEDLRMDCWWYWYGVSKTVREGEMSFGMMAIYLSRHLVEQP